jgi:hypothetical protein
MEPAEHRRGGTTTIITCYLYWALVRNWGQTRRGSLERVKRAAVWGGSRSNDIPSLTASCNRGYGLLQFHGAHPMGGRCEQEGERSRAGTLPVEGREGTEDSIAEVMCEDEEEKSVQKSLNT